MSIPLSGNIQSTPLPDIFEDLRQRKVTGTLTLRRGGFVKCVCIKDGQIVFASSTDPRDRIGEALLKAGMVTRENLDKAVALHAKNAGLKKLGAILVENGMIHPKELFSGLKIQVKDIIFSLFLWPEGDYQFEQRLPDGIIQLQINFQELISEIIERIRQEA